MTVHSCSSCGRTPDSVGFNRDGRTRTGLSKLCLSCRGSLASAASVDLVIVLLKALSAPERREVMEYLRPEFMETWDGRDGFRTSVEKIDDQDPEGFRMLSL